MILRLSMCLFQCSDLLPGDLVIFESNLLSSWILSNENDKIGKLSKDDHVLLIIAINNNNNYYKHFVITSSGVFGYVWLVDNEIKTVIRATCWC